MLRFYNYLESILTDFFMYTDDRVWHFKTLKVCLYNQASKSGLFSSVISSCKIPSMDSGMNKSDRIVLLFLGLGIWVLTLTQIFESNNVNAAKTGATWSSPNITAVTRPCPKGITNLDGDGEKVDCHYLLTIPFDQLDSDPQLFK